MTDKKPIRRPTLEDFLIPQLMQPRSLVEIFALVKRNSIVWAAMNRFALGEWTLTESLQTAVVGLMVGYDLVLRASSSDCHVHTLAGDENPTVLHHLFRLPNLPTEQEIDVLNEEAMQADPEEFQRAVARVKKAMERDSMERGAADLLRSVQKGKEHE